MAFVVDSREWFFNGLTSQQIQSVIEDILRKFDQVFQFDCPVWIGDDLQTQLVYGASDLWSLRGSEPNIQIDDEVWQELAAAIGRTQRYLDEGEWPPGFDDFTVAISTEPATYNPDVAWAHYSVLAQRAVACIGLSRKGCLATASAHGTAKLHWIDDERSQTLFWRDAIDVERDSPATLERFAPFAYPKLRFVPGVWRGLNDLEGGYYTHAKEVQRYFAILSDGGVWAFTAPPPAEVINEAQSIGGEAPSSQLIIRRFILLGLDITPENPNVYRDKLCREARELIVDGVSLYFEWHGKIQAYQNRIHIHAPVEKDKDKRKVLIGIITSHLPLPG